MIADAEHLDDPSIGKQIASKLFDEALYFVSARCCTADTALRDILLAPQLDENKLRLVFETYPELLEKLQIASHTLYRATREWLGGRPFRNRRLIEKLWATLVRMCCRPTPFGAFSAVGLLKGDGALRIGSEELWTRPDMGWFHAYLTAAKQSGAWHDFRVFTNGAHLKRGGYLEVLNFGAKATAAPDRLRQRELLSTSVRRTSAVDFCMDAARSGILPNELEARLSAQFGADLSRSQRLVEALYGAGLLISELQLVDLESPWETIAKLISTRPLNVLTDSLQRVCDVFEPLKTQREYSLQTRSMRDELVALMQSMKQNKDVLQTDCIAEIRGRLPEHVLDDVRIGAALLLSASPMPDTAAYVARFSKRYEGADRLVPLLELLNEFTGIGSPPDMRLHPRRGLDSSRLRIFTQALHSGEACVILSESDARDVFDLPIDPNTLPGSIDLGFQVLAESRTAVDRGDFLVRLTETGAVGAGRLLGRFEHMLPRDDRQTIAVLRRSLSTTDTLDAEVSFVPSIPRFTNVVIRPNTYDYRINIGHAGAPFDGGNNIELTDLLVGIDDGNFFLYSQSHGKLVRPHVTHMLTEAHEIGLVRFFMLVAKQGVRAYSLFDWGMPTRIAPMLPEVRYGRVILSPRRWNVRVHDWRVDDLGAAIDDWRARWGVPSRVAFVELDRRLVIPLDSAFGSRYLKDIIGSTTSEFLEFEEALELQASWIPAGRDTRTAEFVLSSKINLEATRSRPISIPPRNRTKYSPSSAWTYIKLYPYEYAFERLLKANIPTLVARLREDGLKRWFFVRYVDDLPHIRLRLFCDGSAVTMREVALLEVENWMSALLLQRYSIDTYEPEIERYGGSACSMRAAERLFDADSDASAQIIGRTTQNSPERAVEALVSWFGVSAILAPASESAYAVVEGEARRLSSEGRSIVKKARASVLSDQSRWSSSLVRAAAEVRGAVADKSEHERALIYDSITHMHYNRLGFHGGDEGAVRSAQRALLRGLKAELSANEAAITKVLGTSNAPIAVELSRQA